MEREIAVVRTSSIASVLWCVCTSAFVVVPRVTPKSDVPESGPVQSNSVQASSSPEPGSLKGSTSLLVHSASGAGKEQGTGGHSDT